MSSNRPTTVRPGHPPPPAEPPEVRSANLNPPYLSDYDAKRLFTTLSHDEQLVYLLGRLNSELARREPQTGVQATAPAPGPSPATHPALVANFNRVPLDKLIRDFPERPPSYSSLPDQATQGGGALVGTAPARIRPSPLLGGKLSIGLHLEGLHEALLDMRVRDLPRADLVGELYNSGCWAGIRFREVAKLLSLHQDLTVGELLYTKFRFGRVPDHNCVDPARRGLSVLREWDV